MTEAADPLTAGIVGALFRLVDELRAYFDATAVGYGLTPTQALALRDLDDPTSMGILAATLRCEPSTATAVVDRLVERGLVERVAAPGDRRVRRVVLTPAGRALRDEFGGELMRRVPGVTALPEPDRRQLHALLTRLVTALPGPPDGPDCGTGRTASAS